MEFTCIGYGSVYSCIGHIISTHNIQHNNVQFKEYCDGEVLSLTGNAKTSGHYRINIIYPTFKEDEMRKMIGRSDLVYCTDIHHEEDREVLIKQFSDLFDFPYPNRKIFNLKEKSCIPLDKFNVTEENKTALEEIALKHIKCSIDHASREFNRFHSIDRFRREIE